MNEYLKTNRALWNGWTAINQRSDFYDLESFKAGKSSLTAVEVEELGDVSGKSLLHLQCHFGMDTLSWARLGADVTGADFADKAIDLAQSLAAETGIKANFICSDLYELPGVLEGQFDIVFTSYGVLGWLPDLRRWAEVVAHYLKPGGTFYVIEFHPVLLMFDEADARTLKYPYFHSPEPLEIVEKGSYADPGAQFSHDSYQWTYGLGDCVNSLIGAGLRIEFLHEFPFSTWKCWPFLEEDESGWWRVKDRPNMVPLMFSIKAVKG